MKLDLSQSVFITVEGIEGVGKSTAVAYIEQLLTNLAVDFLITREPGGTPIAESIRQVLLSDYPEVMDSNTEMLLMFASRAQHIKQVIKPALKAGKWVVCDRFIDASYAYQGGGRGISDEQIYPLEALVQGELQPTLTLLLDAPATVGMQRARARGKVDRFEQEKLEFFERVREKYLLRAERYASRYKIIDATRALAAVQEDLSTIINTCASKIRVV